MSVKPKLETGGVGGDKMAPSPIKSALKVKIGSAASKEKGDDQNELDEDKEEQEKKLKKVLKDMKAQAESKQKKHKQQAEFKRQIKADVLKGDPETHGTNSSTVSISKQLEIQELTLLNPRFMKWMNICIASINFLTAMHVMWFGIVEEAMADHLIMLETWTCSEPHDLGDVLVRIIIVAWACSSVALLWAEDEETAGICIFWILAKACQIIAYSLVSNFERRGHGGLPALSLTIGTLNLIFDLFCFAAIILYYYHLLGHLPVKDRKRQARVSKQVNNEFYFAGSQRFFQRKMAVEWVCKQQSLKCVQRLINIRTKIQKDATVKFDPESFTINLTQGFLQFMQNTHITNFKYFETLHGTELAEAIKRFTPATAERPAQPLTIEDEQQQELQQELQALKELDQEEGDLGFDTSTTALADQLENEYGEL